MNSEIYEYYELAGNVCIHYLQEVEPNLPENIQPIGLPKSVEIAIKRQVLGSLQQKQVYFYPCSTTVIQPVFYLIKSVLI